MKCFSPIKSPKLKRFSLVSQNPGNKAGDSIISSMEKSANSLGNSRREEGRRGGGKGGGGREEGGGRNGEGAHKTYRLKAYQILERIRGISELN